MSFSQLKSYRRCILTPYLFLLLLFVMDGSAMSKRRRVTKRLYDDEFKYEDPRVLKKSRRKKVVSSSGFEKGPYQCEHCTFSCQNEQSLYQHEEVHFETEHVNECEECCLIFATQSSLRAHQRAKHKDKFSPKGPRIKCPQCNKTFLQKTGLQTHMTIHTGEKPFKCEFCDAGFRLNSSLQRHMFKEHFFLKPFKCDQCGKDFGHNSDLKHHVRSVHAKERRFVCQICHEKFTTNIVLVRHVNIHFDLKLNECKVCGAKFSHSGSLHNHMKVHSEDRAYHCQTCGKSYKLKSHLRNHNCKPLSKKNAIRPACTKSVDIFDSQETNFVINVEPTENSVDCVVSPNKN